MKQVEDATGMATNETKQHSQVLILLTVHLWCPDTFIILLRLTVNFNLINLAQDRDNKLKDNNCHANKAHLKP